MNTPTVKELLEQWDAGDTIWSIELGGLGPGYEQALQITAVEIARELQHYKPVEDKAQNTANVNAIVDRVVHRIDKDVGGLSGAQVGQAKWLAYQWCHNGGPDHLQERAKQQDKSDDCIQVSRDWPKAPEPPVTEYANS